MYVKYFAMNTILGESIKKRLKEMRRNQSWLAEQVGLSPAQITQILQGKRGTTIEKIVDIGLHIGYTREEIIRLYTSEKSPAKTPVRQVLESVLDRIEQVDDSRLQAVTDYAVLIADSLKGKTNESKKESSKKNSV